MHPSQNATCLCQSVSPHSATFWIKTSVAVQLIHLIHSGIFNSNFICGKKSWRPGPPRPFTSTAKLWHYGKNNFLICSLRVMVCCQSWEYCYYSSAAFRYCPRSLESGEAEWLNVFQFKTSYFAITKFFRNRDNRQQRYFFLVWIRWISLNARRYLLIGKALSVGNGDGYCAKEVAFGHLKDVMTSIVRMRSREAAEMY